MELELATFLWMCVKCGKRFEALDWPGDWGAPYGEALMYNRNGEVLFWRLLPNRSFDSYCDLVSHLLKESSDHKKSVATKAVSGVICDSGKDGFILSGTPYCPFCDACEARQIKILETKKHTIPEVTHVIWNSLSEQEKEQRVLAELIRQKFIRPKSLEDKPSS